MFAAVSGQFHGPLPMLRIFPKAAGSVIVLSDDRINAPVLLATRAEAVNGRSSQSHIGQRLRLRMAVRM
jgi:hypothetical protein